MKIGTSVNVILSDTITGVALDPVAGEIVKTFKNGKIRVSIDGEEHTVDATNVSERKPGRKSLAQMMTADELQADVDGLLTKLGKAKSIVDKKRLRRLLRRRGHAGGLGLKGKAAE